MAIEKVTFDQSVSNTGQRKEDPVAFFVTAYQLYLRSRNGLHAAEMSRRGVATSSLLEKVLSDKEELGNVALQMYQESPTLKGLDNNLRTAFNTEPSLQEDTLKFAIDDPYLAACLHPLSLNRNDLNSPAESIRATVDNLKIVEQFVEIGVRSMDSMLISGANAWGPFYAVRGRVPAELTDAGINQIQYREFSDIDFLAVSGSIAGFQHFIEDCVREGLISAKELNRYKVFERLYREKKADIFSMRAHVRGVEESFHLVPFDTLHKICGLEKVHTPKNWIDYVLDFRPNIPANVIKNGGYPTQDLKGLKKVLFRPLMVKVYYPDDAEIAGYISETTIGGQASILREDTYFVGVIPFFLSIAPAILFDRDGGLTDEVSRLKESIRRIMVGQPVRFIPRQDRMAKGTLHRIKQTLI